MEHRKKVLFLLISLSAIAIALWLFNPFPLYFVNDDFIHIPLSKEGVLFQRKSFRPVCDLSIGLDYWLWKKQAWGYHITNLLLHIADTLLVSVLANIIFKRNGTANTPWMSFFAGLLFFIYPFHSETIYWILGRSASLGALFFLAAVIFYLRRNGRVFYFVLSILFFSAGLLTYESVWIFPFIAIGISWMEGKQGLVFFKKEIRYISVICIVFVAFTILRYFAIGEVAGNYDASAFTTLDFKNLLLNAGRLFIRSFTPPVQAITTFYINAFITFLLISFSVFLLWKNKISRLFSLFLLACFLISLTPYLSLGIDTHGSEGERFLYLPSVFVCMFIIYFIFIFFANNYYRLLTVAIIFSCSLFYLYQSRKNYDTASTISKLTINELQKLNGKSRLFVDSLPEECNGAVIFRLGFYEAVKWMKPLPELDTVLISSSLPNVNSSSNKAYLVVPADTFNLEQPEHEIPDYNKATDAVFIYSGSGLTVIK